MRLDNSSGSQTLSATKITEGLAKTLITGSHPWSVRFSRLWVGGVRISISNMFPGGPGADSGVTLDNTGLDNSLQPFYHIMLQIFYLHGEIAAVPTHGRASPYEPNLNN